MRDLRCCLEREGSAVVGVADVERERRGRDVNAELFTFFDHEGVLVEAEIHIDLLTGDIFGREIRDLIDVVAQAVIALLLDEAESDVEAGVLAVGAHAQASCHLALDEGVLLEFGREERDNVGLCLRLILPGVAAEICGKTALEFCGGVGVVGVGLLALAEGEGERLFGSGKIVGAPRVAEKLVIRDFTVLEGSFILAADGVDKADVKVVKNVRTRWCVVKYDRLIVLFVVAVIVRMNEHSAFRLGFGRKGVPHIENTARVDVIEARDDEDRDIRVRQRISGIVTACACVPETVVSGGVEKNIVEARYALAENGLGKVDQREHIVAFEFVGFLTDAFVLVHSDVPVAVKSHFVKAVSIVAVVAFGILHGKDRALDVVRKWCGDLMDCRFVAVADEVELAVIEGLRAYPILQKQPVLALVYVGDAVARALAAPAAMLINDGVSVREPFFHARGKGINDLVLG